MRARKDGAKTNNHYHGDCGGGAGRKEGEAAVDCTAEIVFKTRKRPIIIDNNGVFVTVGIV